jgi:hypothetical protein
MFLKSKVLALSSSEKKRGIHEIVKTCCGRRKIVLKVNSSSSVLMFALCRSVVLHAKTKDETSSTSYLKLVNYDTSVSRCLSAIALGVVC